MSIGGCDIGVRKRVKFGSWENAVVMPQDVKDHAWGRCGEKQGLSLGWFRFEMQLDIQVESAERGPTRDINPEVSISM